MISTARTTIRAILSWLGSVPVTDQIDRRNAPTIQLLLLTIGITLPISWARHLAVATLPPGWSWVIGMDMATSVAAFVAIVLIRYGHFRRAIALFLIVLLAGLHISYLKLGFNALLADQTSQMLLLVISGLMLSRKTLWLMFGALIATFVGGFWVDASRAGASIALAFHNLPSVLFSYFAITLVLDATLTALRESLVDAKTHSRQLEIEIAERERTQSQLIHAQKMEATGRLVSGIAHDFNNILGVVLGFAGERHRLDDPDKDPRRDARSMAEALEGVELSAQRGVALIRKLLSFGRKDPATPEFFDARQALEEMRPMLRQLFPSRVQLEMKMAATTVPVFIDRGQFELMVLNIASNSRDAMPDGGLFTIDVQRDQLSSTAEILLSDNGMGIDEETKPQVFEPFFSTKPLGQHSGLGLAVTRALIIVSKGTIHADSSPGCGTTIRIQLPSPLSTPEARNPHHGRQ